MICKQCKKKAHPQCVQKEYFNHGNIICQFCRKGNTEKYDDKRKDKVLKKGKRGQMVAKQCGFPFNFPASILTPRKTESCLPPNCVFFFPSLEQESKGQPFVIPSQYVAPDFVSAMVEMEKRLGEYNESYMNDFQIDLPMLWRMRNRRFFPDKPKSICLKFCGTQIDEDSHEVEDEDDDELHYWIAPCGRTRYLESIERLEEPSDEDGDGKVHYRLSTGDAAIDLKHFPHKFRNCAMSGMARQGKLRTTKEVMYPRGFLEKNLLVFPCNTDSIHWYNIIVINPAGVIEPNGRESCMLAVDHMRNGLEKEPENKKKPGPYADSQHFYRLVILRALNESLARCTEDKVNQNWYNDDTLPFFGTSMLRMALLSKGMVTNAGAGQPSMFWVSCRIATNQTWIGWVLYGASTATNNTKKQTQESFDGKPPNSICRTFSCSMQRLLSGGRGN